MRRFIPLTLAATLALAACTATGTTDGTASTSSSSLPGLDSWVNSSAMMQSSPEAMMNASAGATASAMMQVSSSAPAMQVSSSTAAMTTSSKPAAAQARTVVVTADNWTFSPSVIRIKKGETVSLQLKGEEGVHGIMVPGLNINQKIDLGQTVTVAVATDVAGTYDFFCNVPCGPGHKQMKGQIIIE